MSIRIIFKSGESFTIRCSEFSLNTNALGNITSCKINGISENKPVFLDFSQIAAIVRLYSDEQTK